MPRRWQLHSLDLFSGCGGLSLGLLQAGFKTVAFSEFNQDAADTFELNLGGPDVERLGRIESLTPSRLKKLKRRLASDRKSIDLVCGGPPCQGYSGIGYRRTNKVDKIGIPSNHLYKRMIRVIKKVRPKLFLFENVRGLLTGRWTKDGMKGEIWDDVRAAFATIPNYQIGWQLVHASDFGVPQNRPRILLIGVRNDLGIRLGPADPANRTANARGLFPKRAGAPPDLVDVLGDLDDPHFKPHQRYSSYLLDPASAFQRRIRRSKEGLGWRNTIDELTDQEYTRHSDRITIRFREMVRYGKAPSGDRTKKFAQRCLPARWAGQSPSITVTSLPDDFVHYARPRILTVREWARLQTFPDWFKFCGPRTTGGVRRTGDANASIEREVPKYTQIGNAVPVRMARAIGSHLARLLATAEQTGRVKSASSRRRPKH